MLLVENDFFHFFFFFLIVIQSSSRKMLSQILFGFFSRHRILPLSSMPLTHIKIFNFQLANPLLPLPFKLNSK